jgi:ABC-type cobalt transport system, ATPase component
MQDIIITENLSFRYEGSEFYSLHDINLKIKKGDFILLCGISGSGKTTLLRAFNGLIPNYYQGEYRGKVIVDGLEVAKHKTYEIAKIVGLVFKILKTSFLHQQLKKR